MFEFRLNVPEPNPLQSVNPIDQTGNVHIIPPVYSMNSNDKNLEQVVHTLQTSCRRGWPREAESLAEMVLFSKSQSSLLNITFRLS